MGAEPGDSSRTGRPFASTLVVVFLPSGEVLFTVPAALSQVEVQTFRLIVTGPVRVCGPKGWHGSAKVACLEAVAVVESPPGVVSVAFSTTGDCIPKRGSGLREIARVVPSGVVIFLVPSAPMNFSVLRPLG